MLHQVAIADPSGLQEMNCRRLGLMVFQGGFVPVQAVASSGRAPILKMTVTMSLDHSGR